MDKFLNGCLWFAIFLLLGVPMCDGHIDNKIQKQAAVYEQKIRNLEERIILLETLLEEE